MISDLKYFDGSLSKIDRIPEKVKSKYLLHLKLIQVGLLSVLLQAKMD